MAKIITIMDPNSFDPTCLLPAANCLFNGGLVAFPTETVYGIGGNALKKESALKIYKAKGRPSDNPIIVHVSKKEDVYSLIQESNAAAEMLMDTFWPGPLTLIFKKANHVPKETTGGLDTIALRMPKHPVALSLIEQANCPVAAPSANLSGKPSATNAQHASDDLFPFVDFIIDAGLSTIGVESTVVDIRDHQAKILRPGMITKDMLMKYVEVKENSVEIFRSPGMKYKHYAPAATVYLLKGHKEDIHHFMEKRLNDQTAFIYVGDYLLDHPNAYPLYQNGHVHLYDIFRHCDEKNVTTIYCEDCSHKEDGVAVMDRILKACSGRIIQL